VTQPVTATDATFQAEVSGDSRTVLVDFWAEWCPPCVNMLGPILEEIAVEEADRVKVVKVNVDENQQYASQFSVFNLPTMIVFKNGQPVDRIVGAMPKAQLLERLQPHVG